VNSNDTGLQRLTEGYAPQWSPDGRHIAFLRSPQPNVHELWVMRLEAT
jgi:Tol biopolymer transport system component